MDIIIAQRRSINSMFYEIKSEITLQKHVAKKKETNYSKYSWTIELNNTRVWD